MGRKTRPIHDTGNHGPLSVRQGIGPPNQFLIFFTPLFSLPVAARWSSRPAPDMAAIFMASYTTLWDTIPPCATGRLK